VEACVRQWRFKIKPRASRFQDGIHGFDLLLDLSAGSTSVMPLPKEGEFDSFVERPEVSSLVTVGMPPDDVTTARGNLKARRSLHFAIR
jgi:hypothetical protein